MPFTAAIVQRDFITIPDLALKLGGAAYLRKLVYGGQWARIRIGMLMAVTPSITGVTYNNINDVQFMFGLCSGKDKPGSSINPLSAIGLSIIGSPVEGATRLLTYTAASGYPYYSPTVGVVYRRVDTVMNVSAGISAALIIPLVGKGNQFRRTPLIIDITRSVGGAGLMTFQIYGATTAAQLQIDFRPDALQAGLDTLGTPTLYGTALTALTAISTITVSDINGPLDTLELFWSNNTYPLEVYAVGATVIMPSMNTVAGASYPAGFGGAVQSFSQYVPAAQQITTFTSDIGLGFLSGGTVTGQSAGTTVIGLPGTSGGFPDESFQQYLTGSVTTAGTSVTSGIDISNGTGWAGYGTIY